MRITFKAYFSLEATPEFALRGSYVVQRIKLELSTCKSRTLNPVLSLWPLKPNFKKKILSSFYMSLLSSKMKKVKLIWQILPDSSNQ